MPMPRASLVGVSKDALATLPYDLLDVCRLLPALVIQPGGAQRLGFALELLATYQIRPAVLLLLKLFNATTDPTAEPAPG